MGKGVSVKNRNRNVVADGFILYKMRKISVNSALLPSWSYIHIKNIVSLNKCDE